MRLHLNKTHSKDRMIRKDLILKDRMIRKDLILSNSVVRLGEF